MQRLFGLRGVLATTAVVAALGCNREESPADLRIELPSQVLSRDPVRAAVWIRDAAGRKRLGTSEYTFTVTPEGLATIDRRGTLVCQRSGDGRVAVTIGGVRAEAPLACRLVERIEAPDVGRVELGSGPFAPTLRVLGEGGMELSGVEPTLSTKNTGVLFPRDNRLVPKSVGSALVLARAGQATAEFKVDVVRRVTSEVLPIDGDTRLHVSLEPGKYELTVKFPVEKRLRIEWRGAPYCDYSGTAREHVSTCVLRTKGGVAFDNPAVLMGGQAEGSTEGVTLLEVP
ncbi:MAG: hypothetical protein DIU78_018285 [Pseudomonadota bacterium]|nr:MAG: hypothetical protein DIU78_04865 [Pseudomonadota bacterium]